MLALLPLLPSLLTPPPRGGDAASTRRSAIQTAASVAALPLWALHSPMAAHAVEGDSNEIGFNGALRADIGPSLRGDGIEVLITDQTYKELDACPKGFFVPTKGGPWTCLEITVTATNNGRRRETAAVDVFGLLFDNEGFACLSTALDATTKGSPVASVPVKIPRGEKRTLTFNAAVQSRSPRPFRFAGWKGTYRSAGTTKTFQSFDDCEVDSSKCEEDEDQPENYKLGLVGKGNNYRN